MRACIVGENPTETEWYQLERRATALKQQGDLDGAIACLKKAQSIRGPLDADTRLAKYLQLAGRFDEAMEEMRHLIDGSLAWADGNFGHRSRSVRRCQQAGWLARLHDDAALICKQEKHWDMMTKHKAESARWWDVNRRLRQIADQDKKTGLEQ